MPRQGWKDIVVRIKNQLAVHNLSIIAAGVAFYAFLSIFPALAALVSIYSLLTDPSDLQKQVGIIQGLLPGEAARLINEELKRILEFHAKLGWSLIGGTLIAIWSAAKGMKAMIESMNIAYDEKEFRGFFKRNGVALLLTLGSILVVIVFLGLIVGVPGYLAGFGKHGLIIDWLINYLRWPILGVGGVFAVSVLYRYGPSRQRLEWKCLTWGAIIATLVWLLGSLLFSFYVANFSSYNKTYGSLGVVVILMMWLLLSVYSVLLGAEINAEMEHQMAEDSIVDGATI